MNCTLCNTFLSEKADEEYYICQNCYAYLKRDDLYFNEANEKNHYEQHNNDVNDTGYQNFTAPVTNTILEYCSTDMLGLDYGCGKGPVITHQLKAKGFLIDLYDPYFYPDTSYLHKTYDYIFSCEVFEHFYHPFDEITKLRKLLNPGGLLIIKTHLFNNQTDFKNWYYRKDQTHVFIYTFKTLEYIAEHFGFDIVRLSEKLVVLRKK
nr:class I SAM-dependent methyltransferase [uncultured Flavobacterium sp.]